MATTTSSASASATTTGVSSSLSMPSQFKVVGIILAVVSGLLIGSSFVLKKKGLIQSQAGGPAGEGVAYLKSAMWWTGMIIMILGEICNFAAYAFVEAIVVTPLGALSVVVCAIMSSFFLNEKLTFFGWVGCFLCIVGSVIIALNGPAEQSVGNIREFQSYFVSIGFLIYGGLAIATAIVIVFFIAPKYGKTSMLWYIAVCSLIGGLSVSCTQALGAAIVTSIRGENQFTYWFTYFVLIFVVVTLLIEVYYLNVALALFNTAMVTPTYYVLFTFCTLVTSVILYRGFNATVASIITVVMGFLVICSGITILQMSKVDPTTLSKLDRKSTILLAANRPTEDAEKGESTAIEEPGVDAIRGSFGALGSIVRARSLASSRGTIRSRHAVHGHSRDDSTGSTVGRLPSLSGMKRHQLFDNPVPPLPEDATERISMYSSIPNPYRPESVRTGEEALGAIPRSPKKNTTIQFRQSDLPGHDHLSVDREGHAAELALDDFIQRATSPLSTTPTGGTATTSGSTVRPLYDDPYALSPRAAAARFNPYPLRQDSLASLPEHTGSSTPEGVESPPRSGAGRFQRSYPHDREMDREESMSLVGAREMGFDNDRDEQRARESGEEGHPGVTNGGIRLLPSLPRR